MKYLRIINDKSKRLFFKKEELKKNVIFLLNKKYSSCLSFGWKEIEAKFSSRVEIKNYCILSGRARGVLRDFKLSRILLRKMGAKGFLSGLRKKSW
jgi:ribosomal protein S14